MPRRDLETTLPTSPPSPSVQHARASGCLDAFRVLGPDDRDGWLNAWADVMGRDPFGHPDFVAAFSPLGSRPACAVVRDAAGAVALPVALRPLEGGGLEVTSPYGYGGPYETGADDAAACRADRFWAAWTVWCRRSGVVCEALRFSLGSSSARSRWPGMTVDRSTNYVRDLSGGSDAVWADVDRKVRKAVTAARRHGLRVEFDPRGERLADFGRLYGATMDRRGATTAYRLDTGRLAQLVAAMSGSVTFGHVLHGDQVVSTELVLHSPDTAYSFLGGTDPRAFPLRANDLLKHEIAREFAERGATAYVLGGGARPGDGVERYKRSFAPRGGVPFSTGQRVLDHAAYDRLCERAGAEHAARAAGAAHDGHFPAFRVGSGAWAAGAAR